MLLSSGKIIGKKLKLPASIPSTIEKRALLIHEGDFIVGDGSDFKVTAETLKSLVKSHNAWIMSKAKGYGGLDSMPMGAFPPILDQHEDDSNDRIVGRLASLLELERRDIPGVGEKLWCVTANIMFLGEITVQKVLDGRIFHLSVGYDEEAEILFETSTVIEPAAPGAMLLKKGKKTNEESKTQGVEMSKKARIARLKKIKKLSKEIGGMKTKLGATKKGIQLSKNAAAVRKKLSKFMQEGKMTPAEFKKFDEAKVKKLSAMDSEAQKLMLEMYEEREPVINPFQRGTTNGVKGSELRGKLEDNQVKKMKAEAKKDMVKMGAKFSKMDDDQKDKDYEMNMGDKTSMMDGVIKEMKEYMEADDKEGMKKCMDKMAECYKEMEGYNEDGEKEMEAGDEGASEQDMSGVQEQVDELSAQLSRVAGIVEELVEEEMEEEEVEAEDADEEADEDKKEASEGDDDEEEKELEEGDDEDEDEKELEEGDKDDEDDDKDKSKAKKKASEDKKSDKE